jgi:hypothetical protein
MGIHHPAEVPHHPNLEDYGTERYIDLYLSGCIPCCKRAHRNFYHGHKVLCPICRTNFMKAGYEVCYQCLATKRKDEIAEKKAAANKLRKRLNKEAREKFLTKITGKDTL